MKKILLATIGFGTWVFLAACGGNDTPSSPTGTGGSAGLAGGTPGSKDGAVGLGLDAGAVGLGSDGQSAGTDVSCDFTAQGMHMCTGFAGLEAAALAQEQTECTQQNQGTLLQAACISTNASGTCKFTSTGTGQFAGIPAGIVVTYVWYSLPAAQIASAQLVCTGTLGGTWSGS